MTNMEQEAEISLKKLLQSDTDTTYRIILSQEEWFFENRLFLPGQFPEKWISLRNDLHKLRHWEKVPSKTPEELTALSSRIDSTAEEAVLEIYSDMNLKPIKLGQNSSEKNQ